MQNRRIGLVMALLLAAALLVSACDAGRNLVPTAPTASMQANRTITVVGQGKAGGAPDVAHINIGVESTGQSAQEAMEANRQQMATLLAKIKSMGVSDKDLQTSNFSIYTERTESTPPKAGAAEPSDQAIIYRVNNMVSVTVRDLASLGDVLDQAVSAGANNIYGVSFEVSDTTKLEAEAREKAIADARARAESLARLTGVGLAEVQQVSEAVSGTGPLYGKVAAEGLGVGTPIEAGELQVTMSVEVTYAIK